MSLSYKPVDKHWFYEVDEENWLPFSYQDSSVIQQSYENNGPDIISTDSGRFDVNIKEKIRIPIYWKAKIDQIRNCSWFYKEFNKNYIPYEEDTADLLEEAYKNALINNKWNVQVKLPNEQIILLQAPKQIYHFLNIEDISQYFWHKLIPGCVVRRGLDKFKIETNDDNNKKIDHLVFVVHGITSGAILKFRSDVEVVEHVRIIASKLIKTNYTNLYDQGTIGNIEVLPVSWQDQIHSPDTKIDEKLNTITLESLPKFRNMVNYSILDVLSYTSPIYCQNIMTTVGNTINENYTKFCKRNKDFNGEVSLIGHSLGALILFDLLCNQRFKSIPSLMSQSSDVYKPTPSFLNRAGTGQVIVNYPQLLFEPQICFALGSPIGLFVALRDTINLGLNFKLPTCLGFYNIFHPFDPVAYRMEGLVNPLLGNNPPFEIPYHKGGKRKHLEFKDTMVRVKNDIKDKVYIMYKNIYEKLTVSSSGSLSKIDQETNEKIEKEVDEILQFQISNEEDILVTTQLDSTVHLNLGKLNNSKRIDYVLQARSFEVNEYLFALNSHVCYWESEDTILFMIKEIYSSLNITLTTENNSTATNSIN